MLGIKNPKTKRLFQNVSYIIAWAGIIATKDQVTLHKFAQNIGLLNLVFGNLGIEFKGVNSFIQYLFSYGISLCYYGLNSVCLILYDGTLPLTFEERWLTSILINLVIASFQFLQIDSRLRDGTVIEKKCILDYRILVITFLAQAILMI